MTALLPIAASWVCGADVRDVPPDWEPAGLRRLAVAEATASSTLGTEDGTYAPRRAIDGDRRTKWVATDAASEAAPQWIELRLARSQVVSAIALFGEAPGNDGVRDAQVQVEAAAPDAFVTAARIDDAKSGAWVASFAPVRTSRVRLLVTRSGGASTHTDVREILVLGQPLSPEELEAAVAASLAAARDLFERVAGASAGDGGARGPIPPPIEQALAAAGARLDGLTARHGAWKSLDDPGRVALAEEGERLEATLSRWADLAGAAIRSHRDRSADVAAARAVPAPATDGGTARLENDHVAVSVDGASGAWDATWRGAEAAVRRATFEVEVDGRRSTPAGAAVVTEAVDDALGRGTLARQRWGEGVEIERTVRVPSDLPVVVVGGSISNRTDRDVSLGAVRTVDASPETGGWWWDGSVLESPGAVFIAGISELLCEPASSPGDDLAGEERRYAGTGVLGLGHRNPSIGLVLGFLRAAEARPDVAATFRPGAGGTALSAHQRFLGRRLRPGETLVLDPVFVGAWPDLHQALERYGDLAAASSVRPVRKGGNSLWCSWYAHRMAMTEDLVLANAAVAARHFRPLGLATIQLDHGWQRGDITGDWTPNERFPHGLRWLSDALRSRFGMKLGVWISPTDVAATSDTFRDHPEWLLRDEAGRPRVNWRWYWKPNPDCFELDASHPEAARFVEETFARLTAEGVSYYKIDFIASASGEHFVQADPYSTRGWGVLSRAMEAIRRGAGPDAWIRYCQTPPLLSAGLAESAYGGSDTLDAGLAGRIDVLRTNARSLAAGWWIQDRLYHREVCDMSVRMQAPIEEARLRLAMMTLAGCSISFSDELQYLPPSRIRMMQRCLPPGCPPMRPLDLLERTIPSVWHIRCRTEADEWDVVGLFNLEDRPEERAVDLAPLGRGGEPGVLAFEVWEERLLGAFRDRIALELPPQSSRILVLRAPRPHPWLVATDMHLLGGWHEVARPAWDEDAKTLSGRCSRAAGLSGRIYVRVPEPWRPRFAFPLDEPSARLTRVEGDLWMHEVEFAAETLDWSIPFERAGEP